MVHEINGSTKYYYLCPLNDIYYNLFLGFINPDIIHALKALNTEGGIAHIKTKIGNHQFSSYIDSPIYMLNCDKENIFSFVADDNEIKFSAENIFENADLPPVMRFPSYFTSGVEPLLDYKLGAEFCVNEKGTWVPYKV